MSIHFGIALFLETPIWITYKFLPPKKTMFKTSEPNLHDFGIQLLIFQRNPTLRKKKFNQDLVPPLCWRTWRSVPSSCGWMEILNKQPSISCESMDLRPSFSTLLTYPSFQNHGSVENAQYWRGNFLWSTDSWFVEEERYPPAIWCGQRVEFP